MKCIIGLGNIGKEYDKTRHNTGFWAIDVLAQKYDVNFNKKLKKCIYGEANIDGQKVIFVKPTTYMNLSGEAVVEVINYFKLNIKDICIVYDDIDLKLGDIRYRESGSSGTHNGMRNIVLLLGSTDFKRIRFGIETRQTREVPPLYDYVLGKYNKEDIVALENVIPKFLENISVFLTNT